MSSRLDNASIIFVIIILIIGYPNTFLRFRLQSFPYPNSNSASAISSYRLRSSDSELSYYDQSYPNSNQRLVRIADKNSGSGDGEQQSSRSRIPDYDENERFKDSSRPPDSHYPPEESSHPSSPQHESPPPSPKSRIPDYDEYARFKNSSRPPDSHYPMGPGPKFRKKSSCDHAISSMELVVWTSILSVCLFYNII
ncbi:unnamed protein product [Arctia plantaginis]|uniref:Uncharacterized protein n=1 Tax=Arctia plantaginis TaxID=874455 RepID=A0A8S0ZX99_ARCPL|nr:unnamed protein product [Arctia plantaginis]CAB3238669.1 unnamed protein product [Arctia plantaginis]